MSLNEIKQQGTVDFPFGFYRVDKRHPRYKMAFHWHGYTELIHVIRGELSITLDNKNSLAKAGDVLFVNSEVIHGATPKNCEYECLVFNPNALKTGNDQCNLFIDDLMARHFSVPERIEDEECKAVVRALMQTMYEQKKGFIFQALGLTMQFFGILQEKGLFTREYNADKDAAKIYKLKKVLRFIRENFASEITLDDMAREADLSTKYFCSFFKNMTGTTPVKYLLTYRVEQAARKLLGTDMSITQIAFDCGFNDLSYFIKTFKDIKKITPNVYRKK